jgi:hypothetical protein
LTFSCDPKIAQIWIQDSCFRRFILSGLSHSTLRNFIWWKGWTREKRWTSDKDMSSKHIDTNSLWMERRWNRRSSVECKTRSSCVTFGSSLNATTEDVSFFSEYSMQLWKHQYSTPHPFPGNSDLILSLIGLHQWTQPLITDVMVLVSFLWGTRSEDSSHFLWFRRRWWRQLPLM